MIEVNQKRMEALMKDFYTLTSIRFVLFDDEEKEIMSYPGHHCAFCRQMRRDPEFLKRCQESDRAAFQKCRLTDDAIVYACHAGLTEAVIRIRDRDRVMGYVMFGQVIDRETQAQARERLFMAGAEALRPAALAVPAKSRAEIHAAATILSALSVYLWSSQLITSPRNGFIGMLDDYIDRHLSARITAAELCAYFGVGRTNLYALANRHLKESVAVYVRRRRVLRASELLLETDLTVCEIAARVGFSDYNYFSRVFRAQTRQGAREFRRTNAPDYQK